MGAVAVPDGVAVPFTLIVAPASDAVGVTVIVSTSLATLTV